MLLVQHRLSVRCTTSGNFAHVQFTDQNREVISSRAIFPDDFVYHFRDASKIQHHPDIAEKKTCFCQKLEDSKYTKTQVGRATWLGCR